MDRAARSASLAVLALVCLAATASRADNPISIENQLPGNPSSEWYQAGPGDPSIQGFATDMSVDRGHTIAFKIATPASAYHIDVYRLGYYQGNGARHVGTGVVTATLPQIQPACLYDDPTGMTDCGNWAESAHWDVPANAVSGVYIAKLTRDDATATSPIYFVVRDDASHSDLLMQTSDATWQAYNLYGGKSVYPAGGGPPGFNHATKASYNRPFDIRHSDGSPGDDLFAAEYPMLRWLEANGYDVTYTSSVDTDRRGNLIPQHRVFLSVGHDEYWSAGQRTNVTAARDAGTHLAFFSGNEVYWKTRFEPSIDGSSTPYRTMVVYKEGTLGENVCGGKCDPTPAWTGLWRDGCAPTYDPVTNGACLPENALTGQLSWNGAIGAIEVPDTFKNIRFWRNTSIASLTTGQTATLSAESLGSEWDWENPTYAAHYPARRLLLSSTVLGGLTHHLSLYRAASGALVFGAGTIQWSWGLDAFHTFDQVPTNADMKQATVNLFADMGAQPASLQAGLVAASASSDAAAPSVTIDVPAEAATVAGPAVVSGTATDVGGGHVGGVEVSLDGGATWQAAVGAESWTFALPEDQIGPVSVVARAFDDSFNVGAASPARSFTVTAPVCPCSLFSDTATPATPDANDGQAIEVGVKFRSVQGGFVTGLRFYKGAANGGTHVGHLWTANGALLATATFTSETASGWQTVALAEPVPIQANTTYVASYHSDGGGYSFTGSYFTTAHVRGPLRALADGEDGGNAVYQYGATTFPNQTFQSANYWADVVFDATPPTVTGFADTDTPTNADLNDGQPIELGVKFQVDVPGAITALRFYKGATNGGTHLGNLWTSSGTLLATATYANETASGWQEVALATPVAVEPGQTYVASYHTSSVYAADGGYFNAEVARPPLRFPASGAVGGNGVFQYGATGFPSNSFNAGNYWADVRFEPDSTAPAITSTSPANAATGVATTTNISAFASEPLDPASVGASSFELRAAGGALVPASVGWNAGAQAAVLDPSADLATGTTYTATVKGGPGGVTDVAGHPLAADVVWSFTTAGSPPPPACLADASAADFGAGSPDANARVASDGTVVLAGTVDEHFVGPALPSGWSSTQWDGSGSAVVAGGSLVVDGARAGTDAVYTPGRTLEFTATFGAQTFQHMGLGLTYDETLFIIFTTGNDSSTVKARSFGPGGDIQTVVGSTGAPHRYRIDWSASSISYWIDGVLVATHAQSIPDSLRPLASDFSSGGPALAVDDVTLTPYLSPGRFTSRVFDAGGLATWGAVTWASVLPAGTSTGVSLRTGDTPVPDATWTPFELLAAPGVSANQAGRYAQYAVDLATADGTATPRFDSIEGACTPIPSDGDADADGILDVHETGTGVYVSPTDTGTSATNPDTDGDGFADGVEIARGSDPNDDDSTPPPAIGADVFDLGDWSQLYVAERALGVAPNGSAVAGGGDRGQGPEGFVWALTSGIVPIGDLPGGDFASEVVAVTNGGAVAVGTGTTASGTFAMRRDAGGLASLGDLPGGAAASRASGVSADGSVVVGTGATTAGDEAFRWTSGGGLVGLGHLPGGGAASEASAVSADGAVVVGTSDSTSGPQAFRWTALSGMQALGDVKGGAFESRAFDVSSDGVFVVGMSQTAFGPAAFLWNGARMQSLGDLPGGGFASAAHAASTSGRVVVGSGTTAAGEEAFVWTRSSGMRRLADILTIERGIDLSGWERLVSADDVSDDGLVVVGRGIAGGVERAFVAVLTGDCSNGVDDDGDAFTDYPADPDCTSPIDVSELPDCGDGYDNDADGATDWPGDVTCYVGAQETAQCGNGVDDDGDGLIDHPNDKNCSSRSDDDEFSTPLCGFGAELVFVLGIVGALRKRRERVS